MNYEGISLIRDFLIEKLFSIHYYKYMNNFQAVEKSHDFWEFFYVERGEAEVASNNHHYKLKRGDIIFHKPKELHSFRTSGTKKTNLIAISFQCNSPKMAFFENKILSVNEREQLLLTDIILEAKNAFSSNLENPYCEELVRMQEQPTGSEQLIFLYLEQFFLQLFRRYSSSCGQISFQALNKKTDTEIYQQILTYLENNISIHLSVERICLANLISRSQLQRLFRERNNSGVIEHFSRMKIHTAQQMIRNQKLNFTQIADQLGYSSIHYFSRQFKKITGMSPSEYASSIEHLSEESD